MIKIFHKQLGKELENKLSSCYLLIGNEQLFLHESVNKIRSTAKLYGFKEKFSFTLDKQNSIENLFTHCKTFHLFITKQIIIIYLSENILNTAVDRILLQLSYFLNSNIIFIICLKKINKTQENSSWFKKFSEIYTVLVFCKTLESTNLQSLITNRAKILKINIDYDAIELLCNYYEGNLSALSQVLEELQLQWPNINLSLSHIKKTVIDSSHFTPINWIDSVLLGNSHRSLHILNKLENDGIEIGILLRMLQRELLFLLQLQFNKKQQSVNHLMIWKSKRKLLSNAKARLNIISLKRAINMLTKSELSLKQNHKQLIWLQLEIISLSICNDNHKMNFPYV